MNETPVSRIPEQHNHTVAITAIIATAIVVLSCIAGCTAVFWTLARAIH